MHQCLKIIILCDRYNKGEPVLRALDFSLIRNVLNKYNTKNLTAFLSVMANSFLFIHFCLVFGLESARRQKDVDPEKLYSQMGCMSKQAYEYLSPELHGAIQAAA